MSVRKALYVCINEKIPRALLRSLWPTNALDGTGLIHAPLQHAINPADMSITLKRTTKYYVDTKALGQIKTFQAEHLELQRSLMDVRWTVGTKPEELMKVVEGVYSNYPTVSKSITDFWEKSKKDQEGVDETIANIPRYMDQYMELNRITADKEAGKKCMEIFSEKGSGPPEKAVPPDKTARPWLPRKNTCKSTGRANVGKSHYAGTTEENPRLDIQDKSRKHLAVDHQGDIPYRERPVSGVVLPLPHPRGPRAL